MKKYFRTTDTAVLSAWNNTDQHREIMVNAFDEFAKHFDAKAIFSKSVTGCRFYGLELNNFGVRNDADLWTKPSSCNAYTSRVRSRIKGKGNTQRLNELKSKYNELKPTISEVSFDDLYTAIGTNWGDIALAGLNWFKYDGAFYIATSAILYEWLDEITASEFQEAKEKLNEEI